MESKIPVKDEVTNELSKIMQIKSPTLRAIKMMLYGMCSQLFWDGNKRTSMIIANKIMVENGCGIITIKEDNILEFNKLLSDYYTTENEEKIIVFMV